MCDPSSASEQKDLLCRLMADTVSRGGIISPVLFNAFRAALEEISYSSVFIGLVTALSTGRFVMSARVRHLVERETALHDPVLSVALTPESLQSLLVSDSIRSQAGLTKRPDPSESVLLQLDELISKVLSFQYDKTTSKSIETMSIALWPYRTKTDANIRRTRLLDAMLAYSSHAPDLKPVLTRLIGFDGIFVANVLYASILLNIGDVRWFDFMDSLHCFSYDTAYYISMAKRISDTIKTKHCDVSLLKWVETAGFTGYRNPPFLDFDYVSETRSLVSGSVPDHTLDTLPTFDEILTEYCDFPVAKSSRYVSFSDFVASGVWATAGTSDVGILNISIGVLHEKIKARKNLVFDVKEIKDLYESCLSTTSQKNVSMIKSELGKIRIASSSDFYNYLMMSWVDSLLDHGYTQIEGSTIDERPNEQLNRLHHMMLSLSGSYTLPFDYKNFDHQASTEEIISIVSFLCSKALLVVPSSGIQEFSLVADNIVSGFKHSTMSTNNPKHVFKVEKGLCSGLRWTSLIGNIWNTVITKRVQILAKRISSSDPITLRYIRGDDSAIYAKNYSSALLVRLCYSALGVATDENKFGILFEQMEFLRQWITTDTIYGYAARTIPGLVQRKPWSSSKWNANDTMFNIFETLSLLKRRLCPADVCNTIWLIEKRIWQMNTGISSYVLSIPVELGGVGIEPWDGLQVCTPHYPKVSKNVARLTNSNDNRLNKLITTLTPLYPSISSYSDGLRKIVAEQQSSIIVSNDIISINRSLRDTFNLLSHRFSQSYKLVPVPKKNTRFLFASTILDDAYISSLSPTPDVYKSTLNRIKTVSFGMYPHFETLWRNISQIKTCVPGFNSMNYLRDNFLIEYQALRSFDLKGMHRSDAIAWLSGSLPSIRRVQLNPLLAPILEKLTAAKLGSPKIFGHRRDLYFSYIHKLALDTEIQLLSSSLHSRLLSW